MEKLYGNKRKVLLYIYKNRKNNLTRFNVPEKIKSIPTYEIRLHLKNLVNTGYIKFIGINDSIQFTSKGLSYFSNETYDNIEICIKSIIFPILVSITTSLLTNLLLR